MLFLQTRKVNKCCGLRWGFSHSRRHTRRNRFHANGIETPLFLVRFSHSEILRRSQAPGIANLRNGGSIASAQRRACVTGSWRLRNPEEYIPVLIIPPLIICKAHPASRVLVPWQVLPLPTRMQPDRQFLEDGI